MKASVPNRSAQDCDSSLRADAGDVGDVQEVCIPAVGRQGVLVRPNLKLFVLAAVLVLAAQALIPNGQSASAKAHAWRAVSAGTVDINQLLAAVHDHPSCELYNRISQHYEKMGNFRRAIFFLRMADKAEPAGDP